MKGSIQDRKKVDNEDGSIGGVVFFLIFVTIVGLLLLIFNPIVDSFTDMKNDQLSNDHIASSQMSFDTFDTILRFWYVYPLIIVLGGGIYLWLVAIRDRENWV
jgi:hypothetical protein